MKKLWVVGLGVLAGCGVGGPFEAVRTTRIEVHPVCPKPEECPDPADFLEGVGKVSPGEAGATRDQAFEAYLVSGAVADRIRLLALALTGPVDDARDGRLAELLAKDPTVRVVAHGSLGELDRLLQSAFAERFRTAACDEARKVDHGRQRGQTKELQRLLAESRQEARHLQKRLEIQGKRLKTLEAQIEELKGIERIIDRREQVSPGG